MGGASAVWAQEEAGEPFDFCEPDENAAYVLDRKSPVITLRKVSHGNYSSFPQVEEIWSDIAPTSVAAGMGNDGYIYAMNAMGASGKSGGNLEVIKYGQSGAQVLGQIADVNGTALGNDWNPYYLHKGNGTAQGLNFIAADVDPQTGYLYIGSLYENPYEYNSGAKALQVLLRVDVTQNPPQLVDVNGDNGFVDLSAAPIPEQTADFAIDADGQYAYGISYPDASGSPLWWKLDLTSGSVVDQHTISGVGRHGAAARLPDGNFAFYSKVAVNVLDADGQFYPDNATGQFPDFLDATGSSDAVACPVKKDDPLPAPTPVPTLSQWGLMLLGLGLGAVAWLRRKQA